MESMNILAGVLIVLAIAGGFWCWWMENHGAEPDSKEENEQHHDN